MSGGDGDKCCDMRLSKWVFAHLDHHNMFGPSRPNYSLRLFSTSRRPHSQISTLHRGPDEHTAHFTQFDREHRHCTRQRHNFFLPAGSRSKNCRFSSCCSPTNHWRLLEARNTLEHMLLRSLRMTLFMLEVGRFQSHDSWLTTDIIIKGQWLLSDLINVRGRISHDSMLGLGWLKIHDSLLVFTLLLQRSF